MREHPPKIDPKTSKMASKMAPQNGLQMGSQTSKMATRQKRLQDNPQYGPNMEGPTFLPDHPYLTNKPTYLLIVYVSATVACSLLSVRAAIRRIAALTDSRDATPSPVKHCYDCLCSFSLRRTHCGGLPRGLLRPPAPPAALTARLSVLLQIASSSSSSSSSSSGGSGISVDGRCADGLQ